VVEGGAEPAGNGEEEFAALLVLPGQAGPQPSCCEADPVSWTKLEMRSASNGYSSSGASNGQSWRRTSADEDFLKTARRGR
jgi:hypothetical protein